MPADGLSQFLNFAIPVGLIGTFFGFIWWKFQEPISFVATSIKEMFASGKTKTVETVQYGKEIIYDI